MDFSEETTPHCGRILVPFGSVLVLVLALVLGFLCRAPFALKMVYCK